MCLIDVIFFSALHIIVSLLPCIAYIFLGCTGASFLLLPKLFLKTYQVILFSPQFGFNLQVLLFVLAPIAIFIWPAFVVLWSLLTALGLPIVTSLECNVEILGAKKDCQYYNNLFAERLNKCISSAKNILIDFYNTNNLSFINSLNDYLHPRADGHVYDIPLIQIIMGFVFFALFLPFSIIFCMLSVIVRIIPGMFNHLCVAWAGADTNDANGRKKCCHECTGCINETVRLCFLVAICLVLLEVLLIPLSSLVGVVIAMNTAVEMFTSVSILNGFQNVYASWYKHIVDFDMSIHQFFFSKSETYCPECNCGGASYENPNENRNTTLGTTTFNNNSNNNSNNVSVSNITMTYTNTSNATNPSAVDANYRAVSATPIQPSAPVILHPRTIVLNAVAAPSNPNAIALEGRSSNTRRLEIMKCWDNFFVMTTAVATNAITEKKIPSEDVENLKSYLFTSVPSLVILQAVERSLSLSYPGIVMHDSITITVDNVPTDSFSLQTFQTLINIRSQLQRLECSQSEYKYLENWVLRGSSNPPRGHFDVEEGIIGPNRVKELKLFASEIMRLSLAMSRMPTFHRRFGEAIQASLIKARSMQVSTYEIQDIGKFVIKSVISSFFEF